MSLLDTLFCSCIELSFYHISAVVSYVIRYSSCEYSIDDDNIHMALAFFIHHAAYIASVGSGFITVPSVISRRPLATRIVRTWNFYNWKFEPSNFAMFFTSTVLDILSRAFQSKDPIFNIFERERCLKSNESSMSRYSGR